MAAFTGSHRYVLDYLAEEVLERQPAQVRTFLLETSVLGAAQRLAVRRGHRPTREPGAAGADRAGGAGSLLVNIPAHIALHRSYLAQLHGDADGTAAFATQALAELHEGEWMLNSTIQGFLAVAEWLRGQLAEAERAFVSSLADWQATDHGGQPAALAPAIRSFFSQP